MKKKILCFLLCGVLLVGLTGCGNEANETSTNEQSNTAEEKVNKEIVCTQDFGNYSKTLGVLIKDDKLIKIENTLTYIGDVDTWCSEMDTRYTKLNQYKGVSYTKDCNEETGVTYVINTWVIDDIEDFNALLGDAVPTQFGGYYFDKETSEFYLNNWYESMDTQGYTCEEK